MYKFSYTAVDRQGRSVQGMIEAVDRKSAIAQLAERGHYALELAEGVSKAVKTLQGSTTRGEPIFVSSRISSRELLLFTEQIATALKAGLPVLEALQIVAKQQAKPAVHMLLEELAEAVRSGRALSEAMEEHSDIFQPLYVSMVRVGETGGILEQTLDQLVKLLSREHKIQTSMRNASAYPVFVLIVGLVSVGIILTWILPKLIDVMGVERGALPVLTRMLLSLSDFLLYYGWLAALLVGAGAYWFRRWKHTDEGRYRWDSFLLRVPRAGKVLRTLAVGRFARTLGSLTQCGIPILEALSVVRDTLGNEVLAREIDHVSEAVKTGSPVAEPLDQSGLFDPLLVQIVAIGEQTGKLDEMLLQAANTFDEQADSALQQFMSLFPAVLILLLAAVIFFLIAGTLLPIVAMDLSPFSA